MIQSHLLTRASLRVQFLALVVALFVVLSIGLNLSPKSCEAGEKWAIMGGYLYPLAIVPPPSINVDLGVADVGDLFELFIENFGAEVGFYIASGKKLYLGVSMSGVLRGDIFSAGPAQYNYQSMITASAYYFFGKGGGASGFYLRGDFGRASMSQKSIVSDLTQIGWGLIGGFGWGFGQKGKGFLLGLDLQHKQLVDNLRTLNFRLSYMW